MSAFEGKKQNQSKIIATAPEIMQAIYGIKD